MKQPIKKVYNKVDKAAGWARTSSKGTKYMSIVVTIEGKEYAFNLLKNTMKAYLKPDCKIYNHTPDYTTINTVKEVK